MSYGTLTLLANGSYQYESTDGAVPPVGATDTFVYTIVDADGDLSTVTLTITLNNANQIPVAGESSAAVDDDGLTGGLAGGDGDIDADDNDSAQAWVTRLCLSARSKEPAATTP